MSILKSLAALAFGAVMLAGCGAREGAPVDAEAPEPAAETPASPVETPADDTMDTMPPDEPDPAMSDSLPKADEPPPVVPAPPPNG